MNAPALPDAAYVAALLTLPGMTPKLLAGMLGQQRAGGVVAQGVLSLVGPTGPGSAPAAVWGGLRTREGRWTDAVGRVDVARLWAAYERAGVRIDLLGDPGYPPELAADPHAPYVLFRSGASVSLAGRRIAIVGTRRASEVGRDIARELGAGLAVAGVRVISGLALGIDGAAHQGVLGAGPGSPIGVVAGGIDCPYPSRHRTLWHQVEGAGVLVSEAPLGTPSNGWRFPARNRIIAGLAEAVVVVESARAGGSMVTVTAAIHRGVPVLAVPGSLRNPAAVGTNELIRDGATPVLGVADVLAALGLTGPAEVAPAEPAVDAALRPVLAAVGWEPTSTDRIVERVAHSPGAVLAALSTLEMQGLVVGGSGRWRRVPGSRRAGS